MPRYNWCHQTTATGRVESGSIQGTHVGLEEPVFLQLLPHCHLSLPSSFIPSFSVFTLSMPLFCHALGCYQEGITAVEHKVLPLPPFLSSLSLSLSLLCTQALFIECNVTHATVRSLPALNTAHTTLTLSSSTQRPCQGSICQSMWCSSQHLLLYGMLYQLFYLTICNILKLLFALQLCLMLNLIIGGLSDTIHSLDALAYWYWIFSSHRLYWTLYLLVNQLLYQKFHLIYLMFNKMLNTQHHIFFLTNLVTYRLFRILYLPLSTLLDALTYWYSSLSKDLIDSIGSSICCTSRCFIRCFI